MLLPVNKDKFKVKMISYVKFNLMEFFIVLIEYYIIIFKSFESSLKISCKILIKLIDFLVSLRF